MFLKNIDRFLTFKNNLLQLSPLDIENMVYHSIYSRGKKYYADGYVLDVKQEDENNVIARVEGSYSNIDEIKLYKEGDVLRGECTCPYGNVCKHIVATLLSINETQALKESIVIVEEDKVLAHLETLSHRELIDLVMEFAPKNFKKEIILKDASEEALHIRLNEIVSFIQFDLSDEELLYQPKLFLQR